MHSFLALDLNFFLVEVKALFNFVLGRLLLTYSVGDNLSFALAHVSGDAERNTAVEVSPCEEVLEVIECPLANLGGLLHLGF